MRQNKDFALRYKKRITYYFEYQKESSKWRIYIDDIYEQTCPWDDYSIDEAEDLAERIIYDLDAKLVSEHDAIPINIFDLLKGKIYYNNNSFL